MTYMLHVLKERDEKIRINLEHEALWSVQGRIIFSTGQFIYEDVNDDISEVYDDLF